jgi:hypothetical protein
MRIMSRAERLTADTLNRNVLRPQHFVLQRMH